VSDPPKSPGLPRIEKSIAGIKSGCVRTASTCSCHACWSPIQIQRSIFCNGRGVKSKIVVRLLLVDSRGWAALPRLAVGGCVPLPPPPPTHQKKRPISNVQEENHSCARRDRW
jgi:hypothetical protein